MNTKLFANTAHGPVNLNNASFLFIRAHKSVQLTSTLWGTTNTAVVVEQHLSEKKIEY